MGFGECSVSGPGGESVRLDSFWAERDAVLVFVRHFNCAGCREHVRELVPRLAELERLGVTTVIIGNGSVAQLEDFIAAEKLAGHPVKVMTDPSLAAYQSASLSRSVMGSIGPRAIGKLAVLMARGYATGRACGDLYQQGGTIYVQRGGKIVFEHHSQRIGDNASIDDVVQLALAARASAVGVT
ncbi:MAG: peroxiredoxin-like family protein [Kofleriaceae bacterium]